jgi:hypothetical protein
VIKSKTAHHLVHSPCSNFDPIANAATETYRQTAPKRVFVHLNALFALTARSKN